MSTSCGDFKGTFDVFLAHDFREIGTMGRSRAWGPSSRRGDPLFAVQVIEERSNILYRVDGDTLSQRGFGSIFRRDVKVVNPTAGSGHSHGKHARDRTKGAGKGKLTQESGIVRRGIHITLGGENPHKDWKVVDSAFFSEGSWGEVNRDSGNRKFCAGALDCSANSFS